MAVITDRRARAIRPGDKPIPAGVVGLTLRPGGARGRGRWNLRFVSPVTGKRRDMGLGAFPEVPVAAALAQARAARESLAAGRDPIIEREERAAIPTFEQAARARWAALAPTFRNAKHRAQWLASLKADIFPAIGARRVDTLTPRDFASALEPVHSRAPETAARIKQRCSAVMAACWAEGHVTANPLDAVDKLLPVAQATARHQPAMPWAEVPAFVREHLTAAPIRAGRAALLFAILTAARSGEVRGMTWAEVDPGAKMWTVPAARMKANRQHRVPLADAALALIRAQWPGGTAPPPGDLVFPAMRGGQLSDMALTSILRRAKAPSDAPGRVATAHGFRSSFRNWAADHGFSTDVAERALAHTIGSKVRAAYERTDRLQARTKMMRRWAAHVMGAKAV